jgi:hypothetical protein
MEDMKVGQVNFDHGFTSDTEGETEDWRLANLHATFSHKEACEFIFWVGNTPEDREKVKGTYKVLGFSEEFLTEIALAQTLDFTYLCFYA